MSSLRPGFLFRCYLQNTKDGHNKHYFVAQRNGSSDVRSAWGGIGNRFAPANMGTKHATSEQAASDYARDVIRAKVKKGYVVVWTTFPEFPAQNSGSWADVVLARALRFPVPDWFNDIDAPPDVSVSPPRAVKAKAIPVLERRNAPWRF